MRVVCVLIALALCGCAQVAQGPPLDDRGQLPEDIDAPAPLPYDDEVEYDPPGKPALRGQVVAGGQPVADASVWVESVNLRAPESNLEEYLATRSMKMTSTDRMGRFQLVLDDALYHITIAAPGHRILRTEPVGNAIDGVTLFELQPRDFMVVAHRGASFYAPENTLASLWKAKWLGADAVEADVRLTRDGQLVVFHDPRLERTSNGTGWLQDWSLQELQRLDAGSWFHSSFAGEPIPTLDQFMDAAETAGVRLILDVKSPPHLRQATWHAVLDAIEAHEAQHRTTFAAFREEGIQACAARITITCSWLRQDTTGHDDLVASALELGAHWLQAKSDILDEGLVARAQASGLKVQAWTLNHPDEWRPMLALGLDGLATDRMGYLVDHLNGVVVDAP